MWGQKIKTIVGNSKLQQKEVASLINVPASSFSQWIKQEYPPLDFIAKICNYYNIPLWKFFAPDDLIVPDLDKEEAETLRLFKNLPTEIRGAGLKALDAVVDAYKAGKKK